MLARTVAGPCRTGRWAEASQIEKFHRCKYLYCPSVTAGRLGFPTAPDMMASSATTGWPATAATALDKDLRHILRCRFKNWAGVGLIPRRADASFFLAEEEPQELSFSSTCPGFFFIHRLSRARLEDDSTSVGCSTGRNKMRSRYCTDR